MRAAALFLALLVAGCSMASDPLRTYGNPVLDADFPDPSVLRAPDGSWYAYATQGSASGTGANIQLARSTDLARWDVLGDALPAKPGWAATTQDFWAPDVSFRDGLYVMYFSAKPDRPEPGQGLCLGVATAETPQGPFTDSGRPLLCAPGFEAIDPFAFDDPDTGKRLLYWGSGFGPIQVQELAPDRLHFAAGSRPTALIHPQPESRPGSYQRLVEAAAVIRRDGFHYLFYSGDNCCGPDAHYAVMVARAKSASGPYETRAAATGAPDSVILRRSERWIAPGHNGLLVDAAGDVWILYHAVDSRRPRARPGDEPNSRRVMLMDRLRWRNGWPEVEGGVPSDGARPAPVP